MAEFWIMYRASAATSLGGECRMLNSRIRLVSLVVTVGWLSSKADSRVVDSVVKEHEIGPIALLEFSKERDDFLSVHIANLRQIPHLGADTSLVEPPGNQGRDRPIHRGHRNPRATSRRT